MIEWFTRNGVAANLLMLTILGLGWHSVSKRIVLEVFPEFAGDTVTVSMSYRGATPTEIEEGIVIKIEEAIQDLDGIEEIVSTANEQSGRVQIEVAPNMDPRDLLDDVKNRVDGISTFPDEADEPNYSIATRRREVISLVIHGEADEASLRLLAERVRDDLTATGDISQVDITEIRPYELGVEVSEDSLDRYGLTFDDVVQAINRSSLDLPAGTVKSDAGEILLRTKGQAYTGDDFAEVIVKQQADGSMVKLRDVASILDGFQEDPVRPRFDGQPCVVLEVYRVGDQDAISVADAVHDYVAETAGHMPPGIQLSPWRDRSVIIKKRLETLLTNAAQGIVLVILVLGIFLRPSLAFWVCLGIPISFAGALFMLPFLGVTINIMSVFAFILVLGIVVDDAIVTGENIYSHIRQDKDPLQATIDGVKEVAVPVTFGVLTTVAAFMPLMFMEGRRGPIFAQIPMIVIPVLLFSLVESKLILPAHLKHQRFNKKQTGLFSRLQGKLADALERWTHRVYTPVLSLALRWRYQVAVAFVASAVIIVSWVVFGHMKFSFFPRIPSETATASLEMPLGTDFEITSDYVDRMNRAALKLQEKYIDPETQESIIEHILATAGSSGGTSGQSHVGRVQFEMTPAESRSLKVPPQQIVREWQELIGPLPGVKELSFRAEIGRGGDPVNIQLVGHDLSRMQEVAGRIKERLATYPGLFGITDTSEDGKVEVQLSLKPDAELLGLTQQDLARQVRQAFSGAEAQRIQRNRDDLRVIVRYPLAQRQTLGSLESMKIRTAAGAEVPIREVADISVSRGFASIKRIDRQRTLNIIADADKDSVDMDRINRSLGEFLPELLAEYPGVTYTLEGEAREQQESFSSLAFGLAVVLCAIYALLAVPLKSYLKPLVVMAVIPFGWAGAVLGHYILGMGLSIFSVLGMLALTGVVVNDSLVLIDFIARAHSEGTSTLEAVKLAGVRRFRAILLTSLTTFAGLTPLMLEKSTQAQFLIPMAVSLGFGVIFATAVTLLLVPVCYMILDDGINGFGFLKRKLWDFPASTTAGA